MSESKKCKRPEMSDLYGIVKDFHRFSLPPDIAPLNINNLLEHCVSQLRIAQISGDERNEWSLLESHIQNVVKFTNERNRDSLISEVIALCLLAGRLSAIPDEIIGTLKRDYESRKKSTLPLERKQEFLKIAKNFAQLVALTLWDKDVDHAIRVGQMCELVWGHIYQFGLDNPLGKCLPDKPQGLKPWLREVAPCYAKKGGRPRNQ